MWSVTRNFIDSLEAIIAFLAELGIGAEFGPVTERAFLPGLEIRGATIWIDRERLLSPGDVLHEAGHIALTPPESRGEQGGTLDADGGMEMAVIAWTYAAALHLQIEPALVFHLDGYRGGSSSLLENFREGRYIGVPVLEWLGMTHTAGRAEAAGIAPYPRMVSWMRGAAP